VRLPRVRTLVAGGKKPSIAEKLFDTDEGPRRDTSLERLAALKPVFDAEGTTTAGNAPGVNDGAGARVGTSEEFARERGIDVLATIVGHAYVAERFAYQGRTPGGRGKLVGNCRPGEVVAAAEIRLAPCPESEIRDRIREMQAWRKATQPTDRRTFGSVFKNPAHELTAGRMLEACGLKVAVTVGSESLLYHGCCLSTLFHSLLKLIPHAGSETQPQPSPLFREQ